MFVEKCEKFNLKLAENEAYRRWGIIVDMEEENQNNLLEQSEEKLVSSNQQDNLFICPKK